MSETRAQLDRKLALLEERAREFSPKQYAREHIPEYLLDRVIGGVLMLVGVKMAWRQIRTRRQQRLRVHNALVAYGR